MRVEKDIAHQKLSQNKQIISDAILSLAELHSFSYVYEYLSAALLDKKVIDSDNKSSFLAGAYAALQVLGDLPRMVEEKKETNFAQEEVQDIIKGMRGE